VRRPAFTLLELIIAMTLLGILAAAAAPTAKRIVKRDKEVRLKQALLEMRGAIDRYKRAVEEGVIEAGDPRQHGYPKDFDALLFGAPLRRDPQQRMRFLRRIPVDPMTGVAEWGMRSTFDPPDREGWGRENLFDVHSLSDGTALDGTEYSQW